MMNGYFKGEEIEIARAVPEYKFVLPARMDNFIIQDLTFESLAKSNPSIAIYKPAIVTGKLAYYKFSRYE